MARNLGYMQYTDTSIENAILGKPFIIITWISWIILGSVRWTSCVALRFLERSPWSQKNPRECLQTSKVEAQLCLKMGYTVGLRNNMKQLLKLGESWSTTAQPNPRNDDSYSRIICLIDLQTPSIATANQHLSLVMALSENELPPKANRFHHPCSPIFTISTDMNTADTRFLLTRPATQHEPAPENGHEAVFGFSFPIFFLYFFHDELGLRSYWSSGTNPKLRLKDGINPSETERSRWPESQLVIRNVQRGCDHFDRLWSLDTLFFPRIFSPNMYICIYNYTYIYTNIYIYIHICICAVPLGWMSPMHANTDRDNLFFFLMGPQRWSKNVFFVTSWAVGGCYLCCQDTQTISQMISHYYPLVNIQKSYWTWPFLVDLPIKNVIFHSYVNVYQRVSIVRQY